ncbi:MAG: hypothetical protein ABSA97_07380 [Verrucomicrobiia bacterium]
MSSGINVSSAGKILVSSAGKILVGGAATACMACSGTQNNAVVAISGSGSCPISSATFAYVNQNQYGNYCEWTWDHYFGGVVGMVALTVVYCLSSGSWCAAVYQEGGPVVYFGAFPATDCSCAASGYALLKNITGISCQGTGKLQASFILPGSACTGFTASIYIPGT